MGLLVLAACNGGEGGTTDDGGTGSEGTTGGSDTTDGGPVDTGGMTMPGTDTGGPVDTGEMTSTGEDSTTDTGTQTDDTTTGAVEPALLSLSVTPQNTIIELDLDTPASQAFVVTANYDDGSGIDVTDEVTWEVSNPMVGTMNGATLDIPAFTENTFMSTLVTASYMDESGEAQVTIAAYTQSGPQPDFFFVLPYEDPAGSQTKDLTFSTDVKSMDVFFNMDTTGSMDGEVTNLQNSLTGTVIPGVTAAVPDTQFGVGAYEDFPISPYGESSCTYGALGGPDQPFELFTPITNDTMAVQNAVNQLGIGGNAIGCGNDGPESAVEAMYQIATGSGLVGPAPTSVPANNDGIGGVGFREGTMPIVVNITDAVSHHDGASACVGVTYTDASVTAVAHSEAETITALNNICARVIQVATATGNCSAQSDGIAYNNGTGALVPPEAWDVAGHPAGCVSGQCCTGVNGAGVAPDAANLCPLTYLAAANGTGVGTSIVAGIQMIALYSPFDVTREWEGVGTDQDGAALPVGTTTADFIKAVTPSSHGVVPVPGVPDPVLTPTTFEGVVPDTDVTFAVEAFNDFVPQTAVPRLFVATIRVLADDCGTLDEREVFILVPPADIKPG